MGGRGASSGGSGWTGGNSTLNPADIVSTTSLVSAREGKQLEVDETLQTFKDVADEYGYIIDDIQIATIKGDGASTMAYYDGSNIAVNASYFEKATMEYVYADCVKNGFHPSQGNKTALQAVASHELGHALTDAVAPKMGAIKGDTANAILKEAKKAGKFKGTVADMAGKISGYAKFNPRECIAEAFSDVYCNGKKANKESQAIVSVMNKYLKGK
jgi:hypothetical protein